ncbi:hypothetical protein P3S67_027965 [Capsicum chacoense]
MNHRLPTIPAEFFDLGYCFSKNYSLIIVFIKKLSGNHTQFRPLINSRDLEYIKVAIWSLFRFPKLFRIKSSIEGNAPKEVVFIHRRMHRRIIFSKEVRNQARGIGAKLADSLFQATMVEPWDRGVPNTFPSINRIP